MYGHAGCRGGGEGGCSGWGRGIGARVRGRGRAGVGGNVQETSISEPWFKNAI